MLEIKSHWLRISSELSQRESGIYLLSNDDQERHQAHHCDGQLAQSQVSDTLDVEPCAITDLSDPDSVTQDSCNEIHANDQG